MKISVVIPVRNEARSIRQLLDALLNQSLPPDEILITDGGSTDATTVIVHEYEQRSASVRLFREARALPGRGRNIAAANASHEWLAFIDAGVVPAHDWLAELAACARHHADADVVFGTWEPITDTFFKECAAIAYAFVPNQDNAEEVKRARAIFSSLMRRSVWQQVGGFPEHLRSAEDHLFITKIDEGGFNVAYTSKAVVKWSMQPNAWRTFKRFVVYSRNNLRAGLGREWQATILKYYVGLVLCALAAAAFFHWWAILAIGLFVSLLAARSVAALWRNRKRYPASIPRNLTRLLTLIPFLFIIDAAAILGSLDWLIRDKLFSGT
jgi:glycosyltransferase involved in cell wall biosynthesis